jgi:hypothetical protein
MKKLLVLFFALLPSIVLAESDIRPSNDSGAPAIDTPCVRDNGSGGGVSEGMSMRMPNMVVSFAINAVHVADATGSLKPCPTDNSMSTAGSREEPAGRDSSSGFDSDSATVILGD